MRGEQAAGADRDAMHRKQDEDGDAERRQPEQVGEHAEEEHDGRRHAVGAEDRPEEHAGEGRGGLQLGLAGQAEGGGEQQQQERGAGGGEGAPGRRVQQAPEREAGADSGEAFSHAFIAVTVARR